MIIKDWKKEVFTIPNLLSMFRLLLIPVYMVIYLNATTAAHYYISGAILAVSSLTDLVDGKIARHFNMQSTLGQLLDPIADKATQFTLTLCLAIKHNNLVLWIVMGLFVVKETFQLIAMCVFYRKGQMLSGALMSGKICTTVLFVSLIILVLMPYIPDTAVTIIAAVDGLFLLIAFADYVRTYAKQTSMIKDIPSEETV